MQKFSKIEAIKHGWEVFKQKFPFFLLLTLVSAIISLLPNIIINLLSQLGDFGNLLMFLMVLPAIYFQLSLGMGMLHIFIRLSDSKNVSLNELFYYIKKPIRVLHFLLAGILFALMIIVPGAFLIGFGVSVKSVPLTVIGIVALVILIVWLGVRLQFYSYLIVDKGKSAIDSLKASSEITKGSVLNLILFGGTVLLMGIGGIAVIAGLAYLLGAFRGNVFGIIVGVIFYIVLVFILNNVIQLSTAYIYRKLEKSN